jgi:hypothetical protein
VTYAEAEPKLRGGGREVGFPGAYRVRFRS